MNIHHFESHIDKTILSRGYSYYVEGHVVDAYEQGENEYIFDIIGSEDYEVLVEIEDSGDIIYSECDCPYDFGPVCKHEVAAYFKLFEMLNKVVGKDLKMKRTQKQTSIEEVLSNLSKEELVQIIIDIANQDAILEQSLLVRYSRGDDKVELEKCQDLINKIVRKFTDREGFIKYRETSAFVREMDAVVKKARSTENPFLAFDIAWLLLEEAIGAIQYADDSDGDIGGLVTDSLQLISEIVTNVNENDQDQKGELFEKLLVQIDNQIFDGWEDFQIDLLHICFEFADDETRRKQLRTKIESMLEKESSNRYAHYRNESLLQLLFQLIEQYGTREETEQFIHEHLQFSSFREKLLKKYLQEKNYRKVVEIAKEGELQDQQYPGLVTNWKKFRYTAYKFLSLKEEQQKLAKELLLGGDFDYYQDLKELNLENQKEFYTTLKQELKTRKGWNISHIFLKLLEEENDLQEILEFVRNNPRYIEDYAERLFILYKEEVIDIYIKYIESIARTSSNRREYQGVCHKIKRYKKLAGKSKQEELIHQLMGLYKKRPAFIDELGKITGK